MDRNIRADLYYKLIKNAIKTQDINENYYQLKEVIRIIYQRMVMFI